MYGGRVSFRGWENLDSSAASPVRNDNSLGADKKSGRLVSDGPWGEYYNT
jgi:hypothetical protein